MDGCLILEEELELSLRHRVTFSSDFEPMGGFDGKFSLWVNGPFDVAVLALMHGRQKVEVALAVLFLSGWEWVSKDPPAGSPD